MSGEPVAVIRFLVTPADPLAAGEIVVHNNARPARRLGSRGFRAWAVVPVEGYQVERCGCGWAPELPEHYTVRAVAVPVAVVGDPGSSGVGRHGA